MADIFYSILNVINPDDLRIFLKVFLYSYFPVKCIEKLCRFTASRTFIDDYWLRLTMAEGVAWQGRTFPSVYWKKMMHGGLKLYSLHSCISVSWYRKISNDLNFILSGKIHAFQAMCIVLWYTLWPAYAYFYNPRNNFHMARRTLRALQIVQHHWNPRVVAMPTLSSLDRWRLSWHHDDFRLHRLSGMGMDQ